MKINKGNNLKYKSKYMSCSLITWNHNETEQLSICFWILEFNKETGKGRASMVIGKHKNIGSFQLHLNQATSYHTISAYWKWKVSGPLILSPPSPEQATVLDQLTPEPPLKTAPFRKQPCPSLSEGEVEKTMFCAKQPRSSQDGRGPGLGDWTRAKHQTQVQLIE